MPQTIATQRLVLRPFTSSDGDAVVAILGNLDVARWLVPIPHPFTHADLRLTEADGTSKWPALAAITREGEVIGGIAMGERLGYYLAPSQWRQGLAGEAAGAAVHHSFDILGVPAISAGFFEGNTASARLLNTLGFRQTNRGEAHCTALGADRPSITVKLTKAEWEARQ